MITDETIKKILDMRREKSTYMEISRALDISKDSVRKFCILYGLDGIKTESPCHHYTQELGETIIDMYMNKGMTPSEIASKLGKNAKNIREFLNRKGYRKAKSWKVNDELIDRVKLPDPIVDPIYYPDRKITPKKVNINGKQYQDIGALFGL